MAIESTTRMPAPGATGLRPPRESADRENANRLDPQERTRRFVQRRLDLPAGGGARPFFGADGFSFGDVIDAINPLQHIPIVSALYRRITGDAIAPAAQLAGGALFGGPLGLAAAVANLAVEADSGEDLGEHVLAFLGAGGAKAPAGSLVSETA